MAWIALGGTCRYIFYFDIANSIGKTPTFKGNRQFIVQRIYIQIVMAKLTFQVPPIVLLKRWLVLSGLPWQDIFTENFSSIILSLNLQMKIDHGNKKKFYK